MTLIFLIVGALLLLPDAYIVFGLLAGRSWWLRGVVLLPTVAYFGVMLKVFLTGDTRQEMLNLLFWLTLCIVFPTLLFVLVSLLGKGVGLFAHGSPFWFNIAGGVVAAAWLGIALYGIIAGWRRIKVEEVAIASPRVPEAFDGYRIVQLSDFHIGTYAAAPETVARIVDRVNSLDPDLIVFTGDLVNSSSEEIDQFKTLLSRLQARDGVLSVLGNHDYCFYRDYVAPDTPGRQLARVVASEKDMKWRMLRNESLQIVRGNDSIAIVGVDNAGSRMFPDKSDLRKAMAGLPADEFKILLSHDPSHWRREVLPASDIDLMLAGHTHAMQFEIAGWSPSSWVYPEWGGLYSEPTSGVSHSASLSQDVPGADSMSQTKSGSYHAGAPLRQLYVSTGIGENIAFRFGAWPQIVLLTLRS